MLTAAVTLAAGLGAVCRYLVGLRLRGAVGTLVVNLTGSLLLGLLLGWEKHHGLDHDVALVLGAGFAGGFTTLSTWAWESVELLLDGQLRRAAANVVGSFALGLVAAAAGLGLAMIS